MTVGGWRCPRLSSRFWTALGCLLGPLLTPLPALAAGDYVRVRFDEPYDTLSVDDGYDVIAFSDGDFGIDNDNGAASIPLPFPFYYGGTTWQTSEFLAVSVNGYAFFSASPVTTPRTQDNTRLYTSSSPNQTLAPWFDDLSVGPVGSNPAGEVRYDVLGDFGSERLIVEWTNVSSWWESVNGQPRQLNFQLVIHQATGAIEFRYGPSSGGPGSSLESASIGLETGAGGAGNYLDAVTGSRGISHGMMSSGRFPSGGFRFTPGDPTPMAAGTYLVGSGGDYPGLSEAVAELNHRGIDGPVVLSLTDAVYDSTRETFPIMVGPVTNASATNTITIEPAFGTASLRSGGRLTGFCGWFTSPSLIGQNNEPILALLGASHLTIRNVSFEAENPGLADRGVLVNNYSTTIGARFNLIENAAIRLRRTNIRTIALEQAASPAPVDSSAANSWNSYRHLTIENTAAGIYLRGDGATPDRGIVIGRGVDGATTVGGETAGDIVLASGDTWGIRAVNQYGIRVFDCEVRNISTTTTGTVTGISIENSAITGVGSGLVTVDGNRIHGLSGASSAVRGLRVDLPAEASSSARIHTNMVWGIQYTGANHSGFRRGGLFLQGAGSGAGATYQIHFNSIRLDTGTSNTSSACLDVNAGSASIVAGGNILANFTGAQSGSYAHYCWKIPSATIGPTLSDNNILYIATAAGGYVARTATTSRSLAAWRALTNAPDLHSPPLNPGYLSANDLHLSTSGLTPAEGQGAFLGGSNAWIGVDIDGDARDPVTPDIGADEGVFNPWPQLDAVAVAIRTPAPGSEVLLNTAFTPRATFQAAGAAAQPSTTCRVTLAGPAPALTEVYSQVATLPSLSTGDTLTLTFPATSIATSGVYTMSARVDLPLDERPANDAIQSNFTTPAPLAGIITVGTAQPAPFNLLNTALDRLKQLGIAGHVVFSLSDASYALGLPTVIPSFPGAGPAGTLTIRPAPGVNTTLRLHDYRGITLDGADYVTIDGSNNGSDSRNMTILVRENLYFWGIGVSLASQGPGAGCTNNVFKNLIVTFDHNPLVVGMNTMAFYSAGPYVQLNIDGEDNDNNHYVNNDISKVAWGFYIRGAVGNPNLGTVIEDNIIGPTGFGTANIGKAGIVLYHQDGAIVRGNDIRYVGLPAYSAGGGFDRCGIALGDISWPPSAPTLCRNLVVTGNVIREINEQGTRSAIGILVAPGTGSSGNLIANNMISGVRANSATGDQAMGLAMTGNSSNDVIAANSILMTGDLDAPGGPATTQSACALRLASPTPAGLSVVDNLLSMNASGADTALPHFSILVSSAAMAFGNPGLDRNDYDARSTNPQARLGGVGLSPPYQVLTDLAGWKTVFSPPQDAGSLAVPVPYLSDSDLHLDPAVNSPVRSAGLPLLAVPFDIDGDPRDSATPDMGADEVRELPEVTVDDAMLDEGHIGSSEMTFVLRLSGPADDTVRVAYRTVAVTAGPDTDFVAVAVPVQVLFEPGDVAQEVAIEVLGDAVDEPDELFEIRLSSPVHAVLGDSIAVGTIVDDDATSGVSDAGPVPVFLARPFPNPVTPATIIRFGVEKPSRVRLDLFDIAGRRISNLVDDILPPGRHEVGWTPSTFTGHPLANGAYILRLDVAGTVRTTRVIVAE